MKVRMITLCAGPGGIWPPGSIVDLPDEQARQFVAGGYAVAVGAKTPSLARESAAVEPEENAARPAAKRKKRTE